MSDDLLEQARQHVASFEAIGGTVAYPFSVRLAKRVISLSEAKDTPLPSTGGRTERESIATAVEGYTDILSKETARKVASRIRALK